jgi:hypothetical protein
MFHNRSCRGRSGKIFGVVTEVRNYCVDSNITIFSWSRNADALYSIRHFLTCKFGIPGSVVEKGLVFEEEAVCW